MQQRSAANGIDARIQGIFLEGPFFTEKHRAPRILRTSLIQILEVFDEWQERADGWIAKIAIAPERDGAQSSVQNGRPRVHVARCSDATYEEALACALNCEHLCSYL